MQLANLRELTDFLRPALAEKVENSDRETQESYLEVYEKAREQEMEAVEELKEIRKAVEGVLELMHNSEPIWEELKEEMQKRFPKKLHIRIKEFESLYEQIDGIGRFI